MDESTKGNQIPPNGVQLPVIQQMFNTCGLASILMLSHDPNRPEIHQNLMKLLEIIQPLIRDECQRQTDYLCLQYAVQYLLLKIENSDIRSFRFLHNYLHGKYGYIYDDQITVIKYMLKNKMEHFLSTQDFRLYDSYKLFLEKHGLVTPDLLRNEMLTMKTDLELKFLMELLGFSFVPQKAGEITNDDFGTGNKGGTENGAGSGTGTENGTGNETGNGTANGTGSGTGTGNGTGNETGNENGTERGAGNRVGEEIGDGTGALYIPAKFSTKRKVRIKLMKKLHDYVISPKYRVLYGFANHWVALSNIIDGESNDPQIEYIDPMSASVKRVGVEFIDDSHRFYLFKQNQINYKKLWSNILEITTNTVKIEEKLQKTHSVEKVVADRQEKGLSNSLFEVLSNVNIISNESKKKTKNPEEENIQPEDEWDVEIDFEFEED